MEPATRVGRATCGYYLLMETCGVCLTLGRHKLFHQGCREMGFYCIFRPSHGALKTPKESELTQTAVKDLADGTNLKTPMLNL
jgi:hypothetical protein